jgi:hypothetical protein
MNPAHEQALALRDYVRRLMQKIEAEDDSLASGEASAYQLDPEN